MKLLEVKGLKKYFPLTKGFFKKVVGYVRAVDDVSFDIKQGETLALVGESGCGKTTTAKSILRAIDPTDGDVILHLDGKDVNIAKLPRDELKPYRRYMQMIFQNPYTSLNPRMKVKEIVGEPLLVNGIAKGKELEDRVAELLKAVGLRPEYMIRYPHAFSGGQRQRIVIARAIALRPKLVVCDEPTSALDVSIRAQILNLLMDLQEEFSLTYLFITHDLSVVEHISDRVAVMYLGKIVELASTEEIFENPKHPYTETLLRSVPKPDPDLREELVPIEGEVPNPANPPSGCYFHPRCPYTKSICKEEYPEFRNLGTEDKPHYVACHFAESLKLRGVKITL
ncbi:oligopeptide/dipeptide ABC transporter, ATPase subunit [Thermotoga petrophila RKU-1]|uniref:Oligopeptide/dipeptide ABC transporter, ATPase subunit n=1 Tax=Thermotoga petrophila (strain ATCC BAA-488 / DSM 13995 / JCM 10881 / RKU-1) TaxID=390874 RepID=A5IL13_THEP1|nr:dipeptide ABC transporter ATP-binding protein [Thermotoga petrophila]ABQ46886.1 oligopeptide/dipeptide ABC transporter, ATPase subunit [Thermotoga petrophila RKU-1]